MKVSPLEGRRKRRKRERKRDGPLHTLHPTLLNTLDPPSESHSPTADAHCVVDPARVAVDDFLCNERPSIKEVEAGVLRGGRRDGREEVVVREEGGGNAGRVGCGRAEAGPHGKSGTGGKVEREAAKSKEARRISESDGPKKQHRGEREGAHLS